MTFYLQLAKTTLITIWKNKILWVFGLFAALLGPGTIYETLLQNYTILSSTQLPYRELIDSAMGMSLPQESLFTLLGQSATANFSNFLYTLVIFIGTAALLIGLFSLITLSLLLIIKKNIALLQNNPANLKSLTQSSAPQILPTLLIQATAKIFIFVITFILALILFNAVSTNLSGWFTGVLYVLFFLVTAGLSLLLYFFTTYATLYLVVYREPLIGSLIKTARLIFKNWLLNLEAAIILLLLTLTGTLILTLTIYLVYMPIVLLYTIFNLAASPLLLIVLKFISLLITIILIILFGALLTAYQTTFWTQLFLNITTSKEKPQSQLIAWYNSRKKNNN